ncbi:MAG: TRAP transporter small permease [Thermoanaerobacteraceae bacterium]|nr:TRAP transporter small permease [Thermoanaerobacteraceae bacterium]
MKKFMDALSNILLTVSGILFFIIFAVLIVNIICRSFLNFSLLWATDFCTLCICWMLAFGMSVGIYKKGHLSVEFIRDKFPKMVVWILNIVLSILTTAFFVMLIFTGWSTALNKMNIVFTTLRWPMGYSFMALPVFAFFSTIFMLYRMGLILMHKD